MRTRLLVLLLVGLLTLLVGCADANRVVTSREITNTPEGAPVFRIGWSGDVYGVQVFDYPRPDPVFEEQCYERVTVGEPLPFDCLPVRVLHAETDAFDRNQPLAVVVSFLAMGGLALFAMRRVSWAPTVEAETDHQTSDGDARQSAVDLMRSVEAERHSRAQALLVGRDVQHPAATGVGVGLLMLVAGTLLVGYGTTLSWGIVTAIFLFLGVGTVAILVMFGGFGRRSNADPLMRRLIFLGGVMLGMMGGALLGIGSRFLLYTLDGVDWPV